MPTGRRFFVAFVVVLALIGLTAWLVRRFGARRRRRPARGRQPRLAVIDAAAVDGRRRLVLIRRDNVEHLLMIGGPTDVVVEHQYRARRAAREPAARCAAARTAPADSAPRARLPIRRHGRCSRSLGPPPPAPPSPRDAARLAPPDDASRAPVPPSAPRAAAADRPASRPARPAAHAAPPSRRTRRATGRRPAAPADAAPIGRMRRHRATPQPRSAPPKPPRRR